MKNPLALAIAAALFATAACAASAQTPTPTPSAAADARRVQKDPEPDKNAISPYLMDRIQVIGQRLFPYQEGIHMDDKYIDTQVKGNGDISTLLRINPSVQFSDSEQTSFNMGEIRPAKISINGGLFNQNSFLLDGVSFNNDLDPTASSNPYSTEHVASDAQGIAVDTDLIGSLTVYDSNVPASFGGFNGGVVDVETRKAGNAFSGRLGWRASRSVWNEYHLRPGVVDAFFSTTRDAYQPVYDKQKLSLMLENRFANGLGLVANVSRLRSKIPLNGYARYYVPPEGLDDAIKKNIRENLSYSLRADYTTASGLEFSANLTYAPTDETYFIANTRNSFFDLERGGYTAGLRMAHTLGAWRLKHGLSHAVADSSRDGRGVNEWYSWQRSVDKPWGNTAQSLEGNWGSLEQRSRSTRYSLDGQREPLQWGRSEHRLQWGVSAARRQGHYQRPHDHHAYIRVQPTTTCTTAAGVVDAHCSLGAVYAPSYRGMGQYFVYMVQRRAGQFEADISDYALYVQDDIRWGNVSLRPGLRVDYDSLSRQTTLAPRFAASWDVFGNQQTLLTGGLNRYYGRSFYAYKLREGRETLETTYERKNTDSHAWQWREAGQGRSFNSFRDIKVPYSDEWTLGLNQRWAGLDFNLKVVDRSNQDEVMRVRIPEITAYRAYYYANVAGARARTWTFSLSPEREWEWRGSRTSLMLALDKTDVRRQYSSSGDEDFDSNFDEAWYSSTVRYNGDLMERKDLPASDFSRPWTARLSTQTTFGESGLSLGQFLRYRSGYTTVLDVGRETLANGETIRVLERASLPRSFSWDANIQYQWNMDAHFKPYARLEVMNLLNRANVATGTASGLYTYEPGRSYWLELGLRF